jgi:phage recombination protein Bet
MSNGGEVATMMRAGPGLAKANLSTRFSEDERKVILDTCCGGASASEAHALIAIAEARGLNPILGECYFVKRYDSQTKRDKWAVQASIDSFRIKAEQTGLYAGQDEPEYEYDEGKNVVLARVRVWRRDWPRPAVGVARWEEYVQTTREGAPTRFWKQMPHNQLAKCAEALALRKAFPAVLAKVYVSEEMDQAENPEPRPRQIAHKEPAKLPPHADAGTCEALSTRIDAAETEQALKAIARDAIKAFKAGVITEAQKAALAAATVAKGKLIRGERESEPEPDAADLNDANEEVGPCE